MSMNSVNLIGRLGRDIEIRTTQSGIPYAFASIAVDRDTKPEGADKYEADWINLTMWRKTAELAAKHLQKGSRIGITGRLQTRSYETGDGQKRYSTDVLVDRFYFADAPKGGGGRQYGDADAPPEPRGGGQGQLASEMQFGEYEDDGDLPF
jgi:single-strand DNA-binding protein